MSDSDSLELDQKPSPPSPSSPSSPGMRPRMQGELRLVQEPQNAKERAIETLLTAKSLALELVEDFRASDRFFKYKAGVIALWLTLSAATVVIACPSASHGPTNSLGAVVKVEQVVALDRNIPVIYIENTSGDDWGDLFVKVNSVYSVAVPGVRAGIKTVVQFDKLINSEGRTAPADLKPQLIELRCNEGEATIDLRDAPQ